MTNTQRPQVIMEREDYAATFELLFEDFKSRHKIMEREDYAATFELLFEDFKSRHKIHQYEMNILMKDISLVLNAITDKAFYTITDR